MEVKPKIYFRADGNAQMGLGHVFRSLALAEMLSDSFECHFIIRNPLEILRKEILKICVSIIQLPETVDHQEEAKRLAVEIPKSIVVLDGYHFKTQYQQILKNQGLKVVCIDDIYEYHFVADVIINHAGGVEKGQYSFEKYTKLFLGLEYALLRKPFREAAKYKKVQKSNNLFICLGGADPQNNTLEVLKKIEDAGETNTCYLVLGGAYLHKEALDDFLKNTNLKVDVLSHLSADEMVFYMNQCARAVTPPSTISYEYLSTGGTLFLKVIADNQLNINRYFLNENLALNFDVDFGKYDAEELSVFLKKQPNIFDGNQEKRLLDIFYRLTTSARLARIQDCKMYFDWANDPMTRQQSYNTEPILYENHETWFKRRLEDNQSILYVVEFNKIPIGQIRFQIENSIATISYSLDKNYRGKGLGKWILTNGISALHEKNPNLEIIGFVKFENVASAVTFRKLGFQEFVAKEIENSYKYIY